MSQRRTSLGQPKRHSYQILDYNPITCKVRPAKKRLELYKDELEWLIEYRNRCRHMGVNGRPLINYVSNTADREFVNVTFFTRDLDTGKPIEKRMLWQDLTRKYDGN